MHGDVRLGGVVWAAFVAFLVIAGLLAVFVSVDAIRRARASAIRAKAPWAYAVVEVLYLVILLLAQFTPRFRVGLGAAAAVATPIAIGVGVAYLLRIVYPKAPVDEASDQDDFGPTRVDVS